MSDSFELRLKGGGLLKREGRNGNVPTAPELAETKGIRAGNGLWLLTIQRAAGISSRYSITSGRLFEALLALGMPVDDARRIAEPDREE